MNSFTLRLKTTPAVSPAANPVSSTVAPKRTALNFIPSRSSVSFVCFPSPIGTALTTERPRMRNTGTGFDAPNGSRSESSSACFRVASDGKSSVSMSISVTRSSAARCSAAYSFILFRNSGSFSRSIESPAASSCPPYFRSRSEQQPRASTRFSPLTLRPEPFPVPPSKEISTDGRLYFSVTRDATIPMTP